ncbi:MULTISPECIES: hypothetical protein [Corynebacterium]|uniref:hypothetical protein n=1 Tax=Corynebacterium TaxID=1716 RepID=UPI001EEFC4F9|nr:MULTISPECIES: hypothetical protein [Corynebacterium]MDK4305071.1 hypothetical protein [Corynebacterium pseudodiphtheriticum]
MSYRVPGIHSLTKNSNEDRALSSREFEASVGVDGLTQVALDSMAVADLRKAAKDEFEASGGSIVVEHFFD